MNVSEFRIGNLVRFQGRNRRIIGIKDNDVVEFKGCKTSVDELKPITLSRDMLEDMGFKVRYDECYRNDHGTLVFVVIDSLYARIDTFNYENIGIYCQSIHELQNLYFSITGTELNVEKFAEK